MTTEELLISIHGPCMTLAAVAKVLCRSEAGLRVSLGRDSEFSRRLRLARVRYGRRVLFRTIDVSKLLSEQFVEDRHGTERHAG